MRLRCLLAALLVCALAPSVRADPLALDFRSAYQNKPALRLVTEDDLPNLTVKVSTIVGWHDAEHFLQLKDGQLLKVSVHGGKPEVVRDQDILERSLTVLAQLRDRDRGSLGPAPEPQMGKGGAGPNSPDTKWTASVRGGNLYITNKDSKTEKKLTTDGSNLILNGKADWVYMEELYGRGNLQTFWWSPDSKYIAFLRLDDTDVPVFTILDHTQRVQTPELTRYPKSGQTNPSVKLGIVSIADGSLNWADLSVFPKDILVTRVGWLPDSSAAWAYVQDRAQTWADVSTVPVEGGKPTVLFRETTKAWVDRDAGPLHFLKDGSFIYLSERTGYRHAYHYSAAGKLKLALTSGEWEARSIAKIDEAAGYVYINCTKDSWLGSQAYRVKLDGTGLEKVTKGGGTHEVLFSPDAQYFTDTWSDLHTPPRITLHHADGSFVRLIDEAVQDKGKDQPKQGKVELVEIKAPDGFVMYGTVLLPPNYDKARKYPVWFKTYAGPHAPQIRNQFGPGGKEDQVAAAQGYIIFHADPRSASGKGAIAHWACYKQLGVSECKDIETCITWLLDTYPGADAKRVGMSGMSYGGYITAYCMTHSKMFAAGIAGAPVTDWHNYDSIYTERYNHLPKDNPDGYAAGSATKAAKNLHGRLLLVHGMKDDNVHVQNTVEMMDALQKANKDFEVMLYPHARHGGFGAHFQKLQTDFMKRTLQPGT
jgi:dipeptidyl-peptidase-4